ncbi:MAG: ATP-dependent DNA helicase [Mobilicoccus sp.]|nr:ATP-dependent DNA helicase [Mobilicoccus sp.]
MALAVEDAVAAEEHLLVQAGTGTGKSLAYLVPAVADAVNTGTPAIVATATLALQAQIVDRDMPRVADSLAPLLGRRPTYALVKGRANYVCLHKLAGGFPDDDGALFGATGLVAQAQAANEGADGDTSSRLGREVVRLRAWAEETESGDRDELVPGVSERAWRQVSVSARECLGTACPMRAECFVEISREAAKDVDVVVTNHSFMAIDAFENRAMLPDHHLLVIDEAHELVDRVTATVTDELSPGTVTAAARKAAKYTGTDDLVGAGEVLAGALQPLPEGRLIRLPDSLGDAMAMLRTDARAVQSGMKAEGKDKGEPDGARAVAKAAVDELVDVIDRILSERALDVVWVTQNPQRGPVLRVAPMSVAMELRDKLFAERTVVLTSATIELGGTFDAVAGTLGLRGEGAPAWQGLDVGSPFDYPRQAIAYVARHLPPPGRDGPSTEMFDELESLMRAAGGRTLGLFSSMRAAQAATEEMRGRFGDDLTILCQGEDQITTLVREFASDASTCLFGTLTLWQGVDVPGPACQLVVIDRIPFPRPDDPLASARTQEIGRRGGNGFMAVSATHAALRLAQGAGRLVRSSTDKGVVAFLDSRMMSARYAGFLQASLPPFWPTDDRDLVLRALERLDEDADEVVPPAPPAPRGVIAASTEHPPAPPTSADGGAVEQIADAVSTGAPAVQDTRTAVTGGHAWSREDDDELKDGRDLGLDADELADHLGIPVEAVQSRLTLLGLS